MHSKLFWGQFLLCSTDKLSYFITQQIKKTWYYTILSHNLCVRPSMAEDNRKAGKTEVLCLSANKLFNSAGMRADIAKGLVHSLTASTTKEVKREFAQCWVTLFLPLFYFWWQCCAELYNIYANMSCYISAVCTHQNCSLQTGDFRQFWSLTWSSLSLIITNMWFF